MCFIILESFAVVEFPPEGEDNKPVVAIVPNVWLYTEEKCSWWPTSFKTQDIILKAIQSKMQPNAKFEKCPFVRILKFYGKFIYNRLNAISHDIS